MGDSRAGPIPKMPMGALVVLVPVLAESVVPLLRRLFAPEVPFRCRLVPAVADGVVALSETVVLRTVVVESARAMRKAGGSWYCWVYVDGCVLWKANCWGG